MAATHLMRVHVRLSMWRELQQLAQDETDRRQETVTVSDLVRAACTNHIKYCQARQQLENLLSPEADAWLDEFTELFADEDAAFVEIDTRSEEGEEDDDDDNEDETELCFLFEDERLNEIVQSFTFVRVYA